MKLYNTMSRKVEEVRPINPPQLGLYACGLTVYDYTHLGHLRKYSMDDVLVRTLRHAGFDVKFVQNVTDVGHLASDEDTGEDKLEKGAKKYKKSVWDIAKQFENFFFRSMDLMGNLRPDVSCRATEHIEQQLEMVKKLEEKGYTYVIEGDGVYFDTSKLDDYGKLARLKPEDLKEGARLGKVEGKKNPTDFALWKFERPGEDRAMVWESPWAKRSFPGWHIECSAMGCHYLGEQFDIHTGGIDHIPVHHTNEIAQAEAAFGKKPFVKYWVHHNFLQVEGEKMSKSLENFYTIDDILDKGYDPKALRLLFLGSHYRSDMNFTWEALAGAQKAWERLLGQVKQIMKQADAAASKNNIEDDAKAAQYLDSFFAAMEDDLKTPEAVAVMWDVVKDEDLSAELKQALLGEFDEVLGFDLFAEAAKFEGSEETIEVNKLPKKIQQLLKDRQQARDQKNWQKSDEIRKEIIELGFEVIDEETGQTVLKK